MKTSRDELVARGVAGAAFFASAAHIFEVVEQTNHGVFAVVYPFGIDGLIYIGIRAAQQGRKVPGFLAIIIGAAYSLLFNADAEGAILMDSLLIAASMPVSMLVSFAIVHTGHTVTEEEPEPKIVEVPVEVEKIVEVRPALLPIVPFVRPDEKSMDERPSIRPVPSIRPGRKASWDVSEAVRLLDEGRTNEETAAKVGTHEKQIQRARRALVLIRGGSPDTEVHAIMKGALSLTIIEAIRKAA